MQDPNVIVKRLRDKYQHIIKEIELAIPGYEPEVEWSISILERLEARLCTYKFGFVFLKDGSLSMRTLFIDFAQYLQDTIGYYGDIEQPLEYSDVFRPEYLHVLKKVFFTLALRLEVAFRFLQVYNREVCKPLGFQIKYCHYRGDCESLFLAEIHNARDLSSEALATRIEAFIDFCIKLTEEIDKELAREEVRPIITREREEVDRRVREGEWLRVDESFLKSLGLDVRPRVNEEALIVS